MISNSNAECTELMSTRPCDGVSSTDKEIECDALTKGSSSAGHRKDHRRQESMYMMTGLYSETGDADSSADDEASVDLLKHDTDEDLAADTNRYETFATPNAVHQNKPPNIGPEKCQSSVQSNTGCSGDASSVVCPFNQLSNGGHSRQSSSGVTAVRDKARLKGPPSLTLLGADEYALSSQDCGLLSYRPAAMQKFARIKIFVLLLSMLVTLQQALSSGYINSVITTIEKRFDIPSTYSGLIASSYEIGNVITVIFVSYLGSRRHIPVWIGIGAVIMGCGSLIFMVPHFSGDLHPGVSLANHNSSIDNICRGVSLLHEPEMDLGRLSSGLAAPPLAAHNNLREDNCIQGRSSTRGPVLLFVLAQLLLGCGGSPLFTLGTTYVDDHVRTESASMYIGCMYSMAAFGPVVGFLLGAYLLSFHMDSFAVDFKAIDPADRRWVGMWWGGFLICGVLLIVVAIPFFSFPKVLTYERKKLRKLELINNTTTTTNTAVNIGQLQSSTLQRTQPPSSVATAISASSSSHMPPPDEKPTPYEPDSGYGQDIKDIPRSMWRLLSNPVYITTCLGACMELMIVSGFIVFLPKYLETQFSLGKSQASVYTGSIAIPGACIGIFMGGCFLKRFQLTPRGAVQFVLVSNLVCLSCYTLLFFLGCDNLRMAGTTIPYYNSSRGSLATSATSSSFSEGSSGGGEPFQVNLTAACNFGCECRMSDVEPVCGNNGLTYFSPCHAGCTAFSAQSNYTNCACVHANVTDFFAGIGGGSQAQASVARDNFDEVTVVPVATAGPCTRPCRTIYPFLMLLFFMTFIVASTQMPLLMIVLRSVSEEERSFALGMQFVIFRLFGYIPAPILFGNMIDSTCLLWKSQCGEKGGRCLLYNIEAFRYKYVGLCSMIKIVALIIFGIDWWLVRRRKCVEDDVPMSKDEMSGSLLSLNNASIHRTHGDYVDLQQFAGECPVSHYASSTVSVAVPSLTYENSKRILIASRHLRNDSKTIQLEMRHDAADDVDRLPPSAMAFAASATNVVPLRVRHTHHRSSSCDVKFLRDDEPNSAKYRRSHGGGGHFRTNSRDCSTTTTNSTAGQEFRHKLTHSRNNSSDRHSSNVKFILNYLNTPKPIVSSAAPVRGHMRNHSYDQIYASAGIRIDGQLMHRRLNPATAVAVLPPVMQSTVTVPSPNDVVALNKQHSSDEDGATLPEVRDLIVGIALTEETSAGNSVLRHRRTGSRDLGALAVSVDPPSPQHGAELEQDEDDDGGSIE